MFCAERVSSGNMNVFHQERGFKEGKPSTSYPINDAITNNSTCASRVHTEAQHKDIPRITLPQKVDFLPDLSDDEDYEDSSGDENSTDGSSGFTSVSGETSEVVSFTSAHREDEGLLVDPGSKEDNHMFCDVCNDWVEGSCFDHIIFQENNEEADAELPECVYIGPSAWREGERGVFARDPIPQGQMMGPLKGPTVVDFVAKSTAEVDYLWEVKLYNGKSVYLLNQPRNKYNWLGWVQFTSYKHCQNVIALQFNAEVFYKALCDITPGTELLSYRGEGLPWTKSIPKESLVAPPRAKNSVDYGVHACVHCPAEFRVKAKLDSHLNSRRHNPLDDVCCRQCPFVGKHRADLRHHLYLKHDEKPFKCPFCPKRFKSALHHQRHLDKGHGNVKKKKLKRCHICGKSFEKNHHLMNHMATHGEKIYECSNCDSKFASEMNLKSHIESRHSDMTFECPSCGKTHNTKQAMKVHQKKYHTAKGLRIRKEKQAEFDRKKAEKQKESEEKKSANQRCRFCSATLATSSARLRHEKRFHPVEIEMDKPREEISPRQGFTCEKCAKFFKSATDLRYHTIRHTGDFPFKCQKCNRGYPLQSELNKHVKRSICGKTVDNNETSPASQ